MRLTQVNPIERLALRGECNVARPVLVSHHDPYGGFQIAGLRVVVIGANPIE